MYEPMQLLNVMCVVHRMWKLLWSSGVLYEHFKDPILNSSKH